MAEEPRGALFPVDGLRCPLCVIVKGEDLVECSPSFDIRIRFPMLDVTCINFDPLSVYALRSFNTYNASSVKTT